MTVPDDDVTATASRDAVATNTTNATNAIGSQGARMRRRMTWVGVCLV